MKTDIKTSIFSINFFTSFVIIILFSAGLLLTIIFHNNIFIFFLTIIPVIVIYKISSIMVKDKQKRSVYIDPLTKLSNREKLIQDLNYTDSPVIFKS